MWLWREFSGLNLAPIIYGSDSNFNSVNLKQNYFEIFSLAISPKVDKKDLALRYRDLQRTVHPDRFAAASEQEQRLSLQYTTLINEAYEVLGSDLKRCIYLLKLKGVELSESEHTAVEPAFLMQQIELRETLEDIEQLENPLQELDQMRSAVKVIVAQLMLDFIGHLAGDSEKAIACATIVIRKMQYMTKLIEEIDQQEEVLLDY